MSQHKLTNSLKVAHSETRIRSFVRLKTKFGHPVKRKTTDRSGLSPKECKGKTGVSCFEGRCPFGRRNTQLFSLPTRATTPQDDFVPEILQTTPRPPKQTNTTTTPPTSINSPQKQEKAAALLLRLSAVAAQLRPSPAHHGAVLAQRREGAGGGLNRHHAVELLLHPAAVAPLVPRTEEHVLDGRSGGIWSSEEKREKQNEARKAPGSQGKAQKKEAPAWYINKKSVGSNTTF